MEKHVGSLEVARNSRICRHGIAIPDARLSSDYLSLYFWLCFSQCVSRLVLNTISVEKPAFCLFGVNHAHFETLTNQTTVVRCGIRKNLLRWCDHNRWIGWIRASKLFFNAIYYQNGELVDSVRILIVRCNTDTMLKKKTWSYANLEPLCGVEWLTFTEKNPIINLMY